MTTRIEVRVESLVPRNPDAPRNPDLLELAQGNYFSPFTLLFHDGSFDTFNEGDSASLAIENQAEDGNGLTLLGSLEEANPNFFGTILASSNPENPIPPDFFPANVASVTLEVDPSHSYFSYASMFLPSNDAFVGNDNPLAFELFDEDGNFTPQDIFVSTVWDAGTEVNDEMSPNAAVFPLPFMPEAGVDEGGTVQVHPAYNEGGTFLGLGYISPTELTVTDEGEPNPIARITITEVPEEPEPPGEIVFSDTGDISTFVEIFRNVVGMGGDDNVNAIGSQGDGFREINWDGGAVPFNMPANFFNNQNPPVNGLPRGVEFSTPSNFSLFGVSNPVLPADPFSGDNEFDTFNSTYPDQFSTFSSPRLFAPLDSNIMDVHFCEPGVFEDGDPVPALVTGFGAVFTDVDLPDSTKLEFFDEDGDLLLSRFVEPDPQGLSFLGVVFEQPVVSKVRITSGNVPLMRGLEDDPLGGVDVVAMDNFIYGEPIVA